MEKRSGRCACGAVSFTALTSKSFGACHCRMCRRWVGGVWFGVRSHGAPEISGPVKIWDSSKIARRATCEKCGTAIWHRSKVGEAATLGLGLFDDQEGWTLVRQIFAEEQPSHYNVSGGNGERGLVFTGWGTLWALITGKMPR